MKNHSLLYELNAPVYLHNLSAEYGRPILLSEVPDEAVQKIAATGADRVWLMGVWQRSPRSIEIGQRDGTLQELFQAVLPDHTEADFIGSAYAVRDYQVNDALGGEAGLAAFRKKLQTHGIGLLLDFVPNHTAPDHPWIHKHPGYYISGSPEDLAAAPESFIDCGGTVLANGRDPQYPAWSDVVQLNAFSPGYRQAAIAAVRSIASHCDGVRCDMAMLMLNEIFGGIWGDRAGAMPKADFWEEIITAVHATHPDFIFLAETYWDTEEALIGQGFDYCYDKPLYDLLLEGNGPGVADYLRKTVGYREHLIGFIENHDEERAAVIYPNDKELAAAAILGSIPGTWLFHDGQAEGFRTRIPVHLSRGPKEETDSSLQQVYTRLLNTLQTWDMASGTWELIPTRNEAVIASAWTVDTTAYIAVINYSDQPHAIELTADITYTDALTGTNFDKSGGQADEPRQYDLEPWQVVLLSPLSPGVS